MGKGEGSWVRGVHGVSALLPGQECQRLGETPPSARGREGPRLPNAHRVNGVNGMDAPRSCGSVLGLFYKTADLITR